ncbi:unnamed protein product [Urochloa humidicola]
MAPPPPPAEILLHLPPGQPEHLFHAALVCKPWLCVLYDPAFRRRYRDFALFVLCPRRAAARSSRSRPGRAMDGVDDPIAGAAVIAREALAVCAPRRRLMCAARGAGSRRARRDAGDVRGGGGGGGGCLAGAGAGDALEEVDAAHVAQKKHLVVARAVLLVGGAARTTPRRGVQRGERVARGAGTAAGSPASCRLDSSALQAVITVSGHRQPETAHLRRPPWRRARPCTGRPPSSAARTAAGSDAAGTPARAKRADGQHRDGARAG